MNAKFAESKIAVVTGGGQGIGKAIALRLAQDGHAVGVLDVNLDGAQATANAIIAAGGTAHAVSVNVIEARSVSAAVAEVVSQLGEPQILVNNAGITRDNLLFKMTVEEWDQVMAVHLRGAFLMSQAVHGYMRAQGWGRIVNMSSTSGHGNRGQSNYSAAKSGVVGFTRTLAKELGRFGITANALAPGFIDTKMLRDTAERVNISFEEFTEQNVVRIPAGRFGTVEDVASAVAFLTSDQSSYISGELIHVGGGFREN